MVRHLLIFFFTLTFSVCSSKAEGIWIILGDKYYVNHTEAANDTLSSKTGKFVLPSFSLSAGAAATSADYVPFWMRANQFGSIPLSGLSGFLAGRVELKYKNSGKLLDWGFAAEGRVNAGSKSQFILPEGYLKARLWIFELRGGRSRQIMGLVDSTLSVGAFAMSGNALGIPKIELSIPEFYTLPILGNWIAFKGNFAHGWIGVLDPIKIERQKLNPANTFFHQSSFYATLGKPNGRIKLYGGFNHQVFWGNERTIYGKNFKLSAWKSFKYVVIGKTMSKEINGLEKGKIGNHLGSIDLGAELKIGSNKLFIYRQNFYDVGALSKLANIKDGLNGVSIENRKVVKKLVYWKKFLVEFLYTVSQAGELNAKYTKSGDENYYNGFYAKGWSYEGLGLGTPFISTITSTKNGLPNDPRDYFNNNRVSVIHFGTVVVVHDFLLTGKISYSSNYGTYGTSAIGHSRGNVRNPSYGLFPRSDQLSGYLEIQKDVSKNLQLGLTLAADKGDLLYNSSGIIINVKKTFK